ncbi:uncharacterized protein I206_103254 [Kwoniella pini CBS 10737]|uniref:Uncharacterized protein n=1 Tax=Kwoniella pini CBS 10737 TaxID=1296096 RepID=A0A1B9IAK1_9TREE|nr:uncharacterized protein I206_01740 [Kwoniella pini CBS 10737]OCF52450.1 hypothetical protein I206_01740 [Kwoniella pini CBS 10737]
MFMKYLAASMALLTCVSALKHEERDVKVLAGAPINALNLTVIPDSPVEGQNVTLDWGYGDAGSAPYNLQIGTGGYYSNLTWLYEYTNLTNTNLSWNVNVTAGETLIFQLWDAINTTTYTQNHLILPNNSTEINVNNSTISSSSSALPSEPTTEDKTEDEDESFLGEVLSTIQKELDE